MTLNSRGTILKRWTKHLRTFEQNDSSENGNTAGISIQQWFTYILCVLRCVNRGGIVRSKPEGSQFLRIIKFILYLFLFTFRSFFTLTNVRSHCLVCPFFAISLSAFTWKKYFMLTMPSHVFANGIWAAFSPCSSSTFAVNHQVNMRRWHFYFRNIFPSLTYFIDVAHPTMATPYHLMTQLFFSSAPVRPFILSTLQTMLSPFAGS